MIMPFLQQRSRPLPPPPLFLRGLAGLVFRISSVAGAQRLLRLFDKTIDKGSAFQPLTACFSSEFGAGPASYSKMARQSTLAQMAAAPGGLVPTV
ncbi:MAG: hypothetical protein HYY78_21270 [Betaproteobacteria bacterium]|nr:hypothetical protein [Betaproteobacteria bacterium]